MTTIQAALEAAETHEADAPRLLMRQLPEGEPYPVEALGGSLAEAAKAIQVRTLTPAGLPAQSVLATAALATQAHCDVALPTGQVKPLSIFLATVAATGERKSSADEYAIQPVRDAVKRDAKAYTQEFASYKNAMDSYEKARAEILKRPKMSMSDRKDVLDDLGPAPIAPLGPTRIPTDATAEGLQKAIACNQPSMGLFTGEGGGFVGGHGMNEDNKLRTVSTLSLLWDGSPVTRLRSSDGATILNGKRLSMHLLLQPEVASLLLCDSLVESQGFLSRLLVVAPKSTAGTRFVNEDQAEFLQPASITLAAYYARIRELLEKSLPIEPDTLNDLQPQMLQMDSITCRGWWQFANHIESQLGPDGDLAPIRGLAAKLPEHAARLAGILAVYNDPETQQINSEYLERGIVLAEHYASELLRLRTGGESDPTLALAQRVLDWLHSPKWGEKLVSLPDVYQFGPHAVQNQQIAARIIGILEDHGWLVRLPQGGLVRGKKRRDVWMIRGAE